MLVRQILSSKPNQSVITVSSRSTVREAIGVLSDKRIGALVVSDSSGQVDGILSERDIVRQLGVAGVEVLVQPIAELMTKAVIGCAPSDTAVSVLEKMTAGRFRHMPVVEEGSLIGVISIGDVVKARIDEVEHENSALTEMIAGNV